ncbi:hypothetical protein JXB41_01230 [Candidatus Woesearchaeota archaeon]|nr:hypothetical protein [Candidatus Woesearchaeota archaeon]
MKRISGIIVKNILGIILFLFVLFLISFMTDQVNIEILSDVVGFLNKNALLLIILTLLFMTSEIFNVFKFPLNLPWPIFNAFGSLYLTRFIFNIFDLVNILTNVSLSWLFEIIKVPLYPIIFLTVLICGYLNLFSVLFKPKEENQQKTIPQKKNKAITWEELGNEFRQTLAEMLTSIRNSIKK